MDKTYRCPKCALVLEKSHRHGYFYKCVECKMTYPLYLLEDSKKIEEVEKDKQLKELRGKL